MLGEPARPGARSSGAAAEPDAEPVGQPGRHRAGRRRRGRRRAAAGGAGRAAGVQPAPSGATHRRPTATPHRRRPGRRQRGADRRGNAVGVVTLVVGIRECGHLKATLCRCSRPGEDRASGSDERDDVELRPLGRTGVQVSELCLGAMTFGREADEATSKAMLDRFLEAGGNFVDTADVYSDGVSEEITGRALGADATRSCWRRRSGSRPAPDPTTSACPVATSASAWRRRCAGSAPTGSTCTRCTAGTSAPRSRRRSRRSTTSSTRARSATSARATSRRGTSRSRSASPRSTAGRRSRSLQPEYSLITRDIERELLPLCRDRGLAVLPWSPLAGGILTGKYRQGEDLPAGTRGGETEEPITFTYRLDDRGVEGRRRGRKVAADIGQDRGAGRAQLGPARSEASPRRSSGPATSPSSTTTWVRVGWTLDKDQRVALDVGERVPARLPVRLHRVRQQQPLSPGRRSVRRSRSRPSGALRVRLTLELRLVQLGVEAARRRAAHRGRPARRSGRRRRRGSGRRRGRSRAGAR